MLTRRSFMKAVGLCLVAPTLPVKALAKIKPAVTGPLSMEDVLTVLILNEGNDNDMPWVFFNVYDTDLHCESIIAEKGFPVKLKRKFVHSLATNREISYSYRKGDRNIIDRKVGSRYPFAIIHDPHPDGHKWLRSVLDEA